LFWAYEARRANLKAGGLCGATGSFSWTRFRHVKDERAFEALNDDEAKLVADEWRDGGPAEL